MQISVNLLNSVYNKVIIRAVVLRYVTRYVSQQGTTRKKGRGPGSMLQFSSPLPLPQQCCKISNSGMEYVTKVKGNLIIHVYGDI